MILNHKSTSALHHAKMKILVKGNENIRTLALAMTLSIILDSQSPQIVAAMESGGEKIKIKPHLKKTEKIQILKNKSCDSQNRTDLEHKLPQAYSYTKCQPMVAS